MNKYFDKKIKDIRNKFTDPTVDPIEISGKLIVKPVTKFTLPYITYKDTYKIIMKMKMSNSSGLDEINTKILCMVPKVTALLMVN